MSTSCLEVSCPCWCREVPIYGKQETDSSSWRVSNLQKDGDKRSIAYIEEVKTGDLYWMDTRESVATKCAMIALGGGFLYAGAVMAFNVIITIPMSLVKLCISIIKEIGEKFKSGVLEGLKFLLLSIVWELPKTLAYDLWTIVRAPIFAVGIELAAIYGIFDPYEGRKWLGTIEYYWHDKISYQMDLRHGGSEECNLCSDIAQDKILFLGYCMQKQGNVSDARFKRAAPAA